MENNTDINEIVDTLLHDVESVLAKLENSFSEPAIEVKKEIEKQQKTLEEISDKIPYPSVRYLTPEPITISESSQFQEKVANTKISSTEVDKTTENTENKILNNTHESTSQYKMIPIPVITQKITNKPSKTPSEESCIVDEPITSKISEKLDKLPEKSVLETDLEVEFIDVPKSVRLLHFFGPPSSGKTAFAIQSAIEIYPRNTYYIMTSHSTSTIKRIKQMINHERWAEFKEIKKRIFPIATQNLEELLAEIEKMKKLVPEDVGLIVIDHLTDYIRGEIYKEEQRVLLREILEQLYLLADEKNCKVLLVNGYSYNTGAPAEDIVESYCDMTLTAEPDQKGVRFIVEEEKLDVQFDDSGIQNLHVNIYFS